ncbi:MAG: type II toxin-antitoxin system VapC family toxin [Chthoniobacterales bacterium]
MNLVDSSAWLEYFANGPNAQFFAPAIENSRDLVVPAIVIYEVFKRVAQQRDEHAALQAISVLQHGHTVELDAVLAMAAARISVKEKLPMADSIILATAHATAAIVWTQDSDFEKFPGVKFRPQKSNLRARAR